MITSVQAVRDSNNSLYRDLVERLGPVDDIDEATEQEIEMAESRIAELEPIQLFSEFLEYNGIVGYDSVIRTALWDLITSGSEYLTTTDKDREEWLRRLLGV